MDTLRLTLMWCTLPIIWAFVEAIFNYEPFKNKTMRQIRDGVIMACGVFYIFGSMYYVIFN